ncbi:MAG: hypothetical protein JHC93_05860 [Parachlamydiales bacterium]|nr:hypothetical protein [Parachlamydiales bacterium]
MSNRVTSEKDSSVHNTQLNAIDTIEAELDKNKKLLNNLEEILDLFKLHVEAQNRMYALEMEMVTNLKNQEILKKENRINELKAYLLEVTNAESSDISDLNCLLHILVSKINKLETSIKKNKVNPVLLTRLYWINDYSLTQCVA